MKTRRPIPKISKKRSDRGEKYHLKRSAIRKKPRKPSEFKRIYHSKERVLFVKGLACASCGRTGDYIENAHIETGGTSRKADYDKIIPLCGRFAPKFSCHGRLHRHGREDLEMWGGFNLDTAAAETEWAWLAFSGSHETGKTQ